MERTKITFNQRFKTDLNYNLTEIKKHRVHYLFLLPYAALFFIFTVVPVLISIYFSFTYFNMLQAPVFIGMQNYFRLFMTDDLFVKALGNTIMFAMITGPGGFMIALIVAWLINDLPRPVRVVLTILLYAPSLAGTSMVSIFKTIIFSSDAQGYLNATLIHWGFLDKPVKYLENPDWLIPLIIFVVLWSSLGTSFLSFIAGLQGVDRQYYEAGAIDGIKNRWQELWYITLPLMKPQLLLGAVLSITSSFNIGAVITALGGNPTPNYCAHTIMQHLADYGTTRFEMGYASAIATVLFIIMISLNKIIQKFLNKVGE